MPLGLRCSYKAVQESAKHSEMLFSALQKLPRNRATFSFYVCEHFGKCKSLEFADGPLMMMMMMMVAIACFSSYPVHVLLLGQTCCCCIFYELCIMGSFTAPPSSLFVITAKPEPFVTIHCEQLLPPLAYTYTHPLTFTHSTHKCHTHFIVFHIVLICVSTRGEKKH